MNKTYYEASCINGSCGRITSGRMNGVVLGQNVGCEYCGDDAFVYSTNIPKQVHSKVHKKSSIRRRYGKIKISKGSDKKKIINSLKKWNNVFKKCLPNKYEDNLLKQLKSKKVRANIADKMYIKSIEKVGKKCVKNIGKKRYSKFIDKLDNKNFWKGYKKYVFFTK